MADPHWRTINGFVKVGILGKSYGTSGELRVRIDQGFEEQVVNAAFLFVDLDGSKVPFEVYQWRMTKDLLVTFADLDDRDQAITLAGQDLFLPNDEISQPAMTPTGDLRFEYLTGYLIYDRASDIEVGRIEEVREFPQQEIAIVVVDEREILIPLHEDLIESIDKDGQIVAMRLPEGLVDMQAEI